MRRCQGNGTMGLRRPLASPERRLVTLKTCHALPILLAAGLSDAPTWSPAQERWEFSVTPYGWLMDVEGTVAALPGQPPLDISVSWQDVLEDVDAGGMIIFGARNAAWVIRGDLLYAETSTGVTQTSGFLRSIDVGNEFGFAGLSIGHVVDEGPRHDVELHAGFRAWWFRTDVAIDTVLPAPLDLSGDASWIDPMIAVVGHYELSENWTLSGAVELGGFGIGSDIASGVLVTADYALRDWVSPGIGWRNIYIDYVDELEYRVNHTGPILGARFSF